MNNDLNRHNYEKIYVATGIVGLVVIVLFFLIFYTKHSYIKIDELKTPVVIETTNPFDDATILAKSAVILDVHNKKFIYEKNPSNVLPLASITKLMTALAVSELIPRDTVVRIENEYVDWSERQELLPGERWNIRDLMSLTLFGSSNTGARAIANVAGAILAKGTTTNPEELFLEYLNLRAYNLNLNSARFYNNSGLDLDEVKSGAYGSAEDVATLINYILKNNPELLEPTKHSKLTVVSNDNIIHNIKNTNIAVNSIPGIIGSKTGFTDLAQGNLAIIFSPGLSGPYIAVVLGSTIDGRFHDINTLVNATIKSLNSQ